MYYAQVVLFSCLFHCIALYDPPGSPADHDTCQSTLPPLINFAAFLPFIVVAAVDSSGSTGAARILHYVFCVVDPPFTLLGSLYRIFRVQMVASAEGVESVSAGDYWLIGNDVLPTLLIMLGFCVVFALVVLRLEGGGSGGRPGDAGGGRDRL